MLTGFIMAVGYSYMECQTRIASEIIGETPNNLENAIKVKMKQIHPLITIKMDDLIKELMEENQNLRNENIMLKDLVKTFKIQLNEAKSDLITEKAIQRGKP